MSHSRVGAAEQKRTAPLKPFGTGFETKVCALIYEFDEFQFEPRNARLSRRGVLLHTVPKAMQVLEVLLDGQAATGTPCSTLSGDESSSRPEP